MRRATACCPRKPSSMRSPRDFRPRPAPPRAPPPSRSAEEDKCLERALAQCDEASFTLAQWQRIAAQLPARSVEDCRRRFEQLEARAAVPGGEGAAAGREGAARSGGARAAPGARGRRRVGLFSFRFIHGVQLSRATLTGRGPARFYTFSPHKKRRRTSSASRPATCRCRCTRTRRRTLAAAAHLTWCAVPHAPLVSLGANWDHATLARGRAVGVTQRRRLIPFYNSILKIKMPCTCAGPHEPQPRAGRGAQARGGKAVRGRPRQRRRGAECGQQRGAAVRVTGAQKGRAVD